MAKRNLSFTQLFNLSFGFFGVQIAYALQSANISRIFATLGADPHTLSFFWILPPLMGMIVQPLVGKYSDKTWTRLGRRKPYLLVGALIAVAVMLLLPNAGDFTFAQSAFLGLNAAMWFGLFSLMFLDTSINIAMQPFKMMVGDMVNEEQKGTAYAIQSALCNAGSVVGYLFPIFFTWIGIANEAPEGVIPDSVKWSFYAGAAILILCSLYTFATVKELNPEEYAEFHGIKEDNKSDVINHKSEEKGFIGLLKEAPSAFWTVGLVQFFCWAAFMYMWTYSNGAIASNCYGWDGVNWIAPLGDDLAFTREMDRKQRCVRHLAARRSGWIHLYLVCNESVRPLDQLRSRRRSLGSHAGIAFHHRHQRHQGWKHGILSWPVQLHNLHSADYCSPLRWFTP